MELLLETGKGGCCSQINDLSSVSVWKCGHLQAYSVLLFLPQPILPEIKKKSFPLMGWTALVP
jgi:hypothetical protein